MFSDRTVPLAILLAVGLTATVYLLAIVSYHAALTMPQIVSGVAVAAVSCQSFMFTSLETEL